MTNREQGNIFSEIHNPQENVSSHEKNIRGFSKKYYKPSLSDLSIHTSEKKI
jgi:hypothetical protein